MKRKKKLLIALMVMLIINLVIDHSIRFGQAEAIDFNLDEGEHYVFLESDLKSKSWCINWQYNSTNHYHTTDFIGLEVWVVTQVLYESWDKINANSIVGRLISSGTNDSGKFRLPSKNVWYIVIYNKIGSLRAYVTGEFTFDLEPILSSNRNKLLVIFSALVVISGIAIPLFVSQRKKLKRIKALQEITQETTRKVVNCYYCGFPIDENDLSCASCKKDLITCVVCKLPISFGDDIGQCSLCESKGHLSHLQEWVKVKGKCPHCLQEMPIESIMEFETNNVKKENQSS